MIENQLNKLSEQLLLSVKMEEDSASIQFELASLAFDSLKKHLFDDEKKKAFWINIYNAYFLILRKDREVKKSDIYKKQLIEIAGRLFSLDNVEHGILRKYRYKYSLGFFVNVMTSKFVKEHAVDSLDYRIHFALNCGAKSCPPIAFYNPEKVNEQLDLSTQSFLEAESDFNDQKMIVSTTKLFLAYYWDFGGKKGIRKIFLSQLNKDISDYKIRYKKYSWEERLNNFVSD